MKLLVTGSAGFIGNALSLRLLNNGHRVIGLDNLNSYYDVALKKARLARIKDHPNFTEAHVDLEDQKAVEALFQEHVPQRVVNLAAQAGVRHSLESPRTYTNTNISGFLNILEGCRASDVEHLVYASSSSVYGTNDKAPFSENDPVDHPISLYAATKRSNELMAHSYSHLFNIPTTGLRFFTVYGPWGRPDMALFLFTKAIIEGQPINVFNHGKMSRSFTYIDDIIEGVVRVLDRIPEAASTENILTPAQSRTAPFRIFNIGNNSAESLLHYIEVLEKNLARKATINMMPLQAGDVPDSWADVSELNDEVGYRPETSIDDGVKAFVSWYTSYY